jgi:hypothetical protein
VGELEQQLVHGAARLLQPRLHLGRRHVEPPCQGCVRIKGWAAGLHGRLQAELLGR